MLQVNFLRENKEMVIEGFRKRNFSDENLLIIDSIISLDDERKSIQKSLDDKLSISNQTAAKIGQLLKNGEKLAAETAKADVSSLKTEISALEEKMRTIATELDNQMISLPNVPHESVAFGKTPEDNIVYQEWPTELPVLPETALPHWDLAKKYDIFDLELGTKITGAGFPVYRKKGARLQRALINFFIDQAVEQGFEEIIPPLMVNEASARGTGQIPDKEAQMYYVEKDDLYLIPTAEVPITNLYRDVILNEDQFPIKMTGYTPCFRREAGSYGAHVRGLNRVHQFDKVEIVVLEHPDRSYQTLQEMLKHVSSLMSKLELPYRILHLCGGDMGFASASTYDFEVYSAAQKRWLEVSSVSNFETFQANRLKLRYRDGSKKTQLAHTLNGSALALARIVAALIENNQTEEGILIPEALQPYTGFKILN
ncbi:MAG: serine--tRNA ligase [Saprospiraceae bacterium]|jgi:seryl-tRNA synthetase|nr:serine--tRNA ligase [Saprospiraceae bacterium]